MVRMSLLNETKETKLIIKLILLYVIGLQKLLTASSRLLCHAFLIIKSDQYSPAIQQEAHLPRWPEIIHLQYLLQCKFIFMATSVHCILLYNCVFMVTVNTLTRARNECVSAAPPRPCCKRGR